MPEINKITVVFTRVTWETPQYECDEVTPEVEQKVFSLDESLKDPTFVEVLKSKGFYTKDDISTTGVDHLDNFVYELDQNGYIRFDKVLDSNNFWRGRLAGVFQEVVGANRYPHIAKYNKLREKEDYKLQKQKSERRIVKAKKILEEASP